MLHTPTSCLAPSLHSCRRSPADLYGILVSMRCMNMPSDDGTTELFDWTPILKDPIVEALTGEQGWIPVELILDRKTMDDEYAADLYESGQARVTLHYNTLWRGLDNDRRLEALNRALKELVKSILEDKMMDMVGQTERCYRLKRDMTGKQAVYAMHKLHLTSLNTIPRPAPSHDKLTAPWRGFKSPSRHPSHPTRLTPPHRINTPSHPPVS